MDTTKRNLMLAATASVVVMGAAGLPSCSTTAGKTVDPAVIDQINQAIASTCSTAVVVAAVTITAIVVASFPVAAGVAALAPNVAQQIATFICNLIPPVTGGTPPAPAKAVLAGVEVELHGWHVAGGKAVWF